jgi:hypothetical protein
MHSDAAVPAPRAVFAERFALLYVEAGDPPLKRVAESVARMRRVDAQGRPLRVTIQRLSDWRRGNNVPAQFGALEIVLERLIGEARRRHPYPSIHGLYDVASWEELWQDAVTCPVTDPGPEGGAAASKPSSGGAPCPYQGLSAFRPEHASWFFGRERSTAILLSRLRVAAGLVVLIGASGAGKSSLLRAGLVPAVDIGALAGDEGGEWRAIVLTPGDDPLKELIHHVPELADALASARVEDADTPKANFDTEVRDAVRKCATRIAGAGARLVLVVDQFEEAFTLSSGEADVRTFVRALSAICSPSPDGRDTPGIVVLGVRADFYEQCLNYPELIDALQDRQLVLGPMTTSELREAVTGPARSVGLKLESGLADIMLRDLGVGPSRTRLAAGQGAYDAGALPLLSHALLATWQRRQAGRLTIAGYRAAGGIEGALAATAERAWADLGKARQTEARQLLLRLVRVGEDTQDTRRRVTREELIEQAPDPALASEALEILTAARLVMLDAGSVEVTHESLLHAWPRLRGWIDEDRVGSLTRQRLEEDARAWAIHDRDASLLYRGTRLENARRSANTHVSALTGQANEFLTASIRLRRRTTWTRRTAMAMVIVFALVAAGAATVAARQRDDARFRQVVAEASRFREADPSLSAHLYLVAFRMRGKDPEALSGKYSEVL